MTAFFSWHLPASSAGHMIYIVLEYVDVAVTYL